MRIKIDVAGYDGYVTMKPFTMGTWFEWRGVLRTGCDIYDDELDNRIVASLWGVLAVIDKWDIYEVDETGKKKKVKKPEPGANPNDLDYNLGAWLQAGEPSQYVMEHVSPTPKNLPKES